MKTVVITKKALLIFCAAVCLLIGIFVQRLFFNWAPFCFMEEGLPPSANMGTIRRVLDKNLILSRLSPDGRCLYVPEMQLAKAKGALDDASHR